MIIKSRRITVAGSRPLYAESNTIIKEHHITTVPLLGYLERKASKTSWTNNFRELTLHNGNLNCTT